MSNVTMKGFLKGLRYISQIFDPNEKERELQIGYPTDVVHVSHVGCDGVLSNPSLMQELQRSQGNAAGGADPKKGSNSPMTVVPPPPHGDSKITSSVRDGSLQENSPPGQGAVQKHKQRRNRSTPDEPNWTYPDSKLPRRRGSTGTSAAEVMDATENGGGSGRVNGRHGNKLARNRGEEDGRRESAPPPIPKQSRTKRHSKQGLRDG